jgi:hypothetical protein
MLSIAVENDDANLRRKVINLNFSKLPGFTPDDLGKLVAICKPLGKWRQHVARD